jgi:hypothetical protein
VVVDTDEQGLTEKARQIGGREPHKRRCSAVPRTRSAGVSSQGSYSTPLCYGR